MALDAVRPLQAFDAGGRARSFSTMVMVITDAKEAGLSDDQVYGALQLVD